MELGERDEIGRALCEDVSEIPDLELLAGRDDQDAFADAEQTARERWQRHLAMGIEHRLDGKTKTTARGGIRGGVAMIASQRVILFG